MTKEYETLSVLVADTVAKDTNFSFLASGSTVMAGADCAAMFRVPFAVQPDNTGIVVLGFD